MIVAGFVDRRLQFAGQMLDYGEGQRAEERHLAQQGQFWARGRDPAVDGPQSWHERGGGHHEQRAGRY
jgi:hypothetical protein